MLYHQPSRHNFFSVLAFISLLFMVLQLSGCSTTSASRYSSAHDAAPINYVDVSKIPNAVPKEEPLSRYGNPRSYVVDGYRYNVLHSTKGYSKVGYASWYGTKFHNQLTSTREVYNVWSMTAASTILPLPTYVRVTNLANGCSVIVKVNDRGPFRSNRILDLSYAAAMKLGYANRGTALVRVTAIDPKIWLAENSRREKTQIVNYAMNETTHPASAMYLQVGAFANRTTADNLKARLAQFTSAPIEIKPTYRNDGAIYKVHIGPIYDNNKYAELRQQLISHGFTNPIAVNS